MGFEEIVRSSPFYREWYENYRDRVERARELLLENGFTAAKGPIHDKVVATVFGTFQTDFIAYHVDHLVTRSNGFEVRQKEPVISFFQEEDGELRFIKQEGLELFIPEYMACPDVLYVGDELPKGIDETTVGVKKIGHKRPPKEYFPEEQLKAEQPGLYARILEKIESSKMDLDALKEEIERAAKHHGISVEIETRYKTPMGIYSQMQRMRKTDLNKILDINGIRILTTEISGCYRMFDSIRELQGVSFYVRDLIAVPKPNGFQALIAKPYQDVSLEIQIQTPKMKERAERGSASDYRVFRE